MGKTFIIIPTYNQEDSTIRCFDSISINTKDYEIIWIDNGSSFESHEKVKEFLDKKNISYKLIQNKENLGFVKAMNQGIKESLKNNCDFIAFMNNDVEVYFGWLDRLKKVLEKDDRNGIVGPISSNGTWMQSIDYLPMQYPDIFFDIPEYNNDPKAYSEIIEKKYDNLSKEVFFHIAFFCTLLKRSTVEDIGYLSEELGMGYFDDNDYCERALIKGWRIFICADVFVFHSHGETFKSKFSYDEKMKMFNQNKDIFEKKFNKGKYEKPIDNIENLGVLRLELKRLRGNVGKKTFKKCEKDDLTLIKKKLEEVSKENRMIKRSKFWKLRNAYLKMKKATLGNWIK